MTPFLSVDNLSVNYGRLTALRDVSIKVDQGEIVCIVGPNGAGKSSLMNAIAGGISPTGGAITISGQNIVGMRPERIARLGLSLIPEGRQVFSTLTVEENLRLGTLRRRKGPGDDARFSEILRLFPRLAERRSAPAGTLSGGEQQMLVIGRALMTQARLIMIDEPSLGLAPMIVDHVYAILDDLRRKDGVTLLINEQSSQRILRYADRIYVLRNGTMRLEGTATELSDGEAIKQAYFGFHASAPSTGAF